MASKLFRMYVGICQYVYVTAYKNQTVTLQTMCKAFQTIFSDPQVVSTISVVAVVFLLMLWCILCRTFCEIWVCIFNFLCLSWKDPTVMSSGTIRSCMGRDECQLEEANPRGHLGSKRTPNYRDAVCWMFSRLILAHFRQSAVGMHRWLTWGMVYSFECLNK